MKFLEAKIVTLGQWGVGKTSIVQRYVDKKFDLCHGSTIGASYFWCKMDVDDVKVALHIWDTGGQERFRSIIPMYFRAANGVLLTFDITNYQSFSHLQSVLREFRKYSDQNVVLSLIGNKSDLIQRREVSEQEAKDYAYLIGAFYYEVSALRDIGIDEIFQATASSLVEIARNERNTNMRINLCSKSVDESRDQVLKLLNNTNNVKKKRCSCQ